MFVKLDHPPVSKKEYLDMVSPELADELTDLADELRGLRLVHINSTATGGGVAEIMQSLVPLTNGLGVATERVVINPPPQFFEVTKRIHNLLQGAEGTLSSEELEVYFQSIQTVAEDMRRQHLTADVWFLHEPQLLTLARFYPGNQTRPGFGFATLTSRLPTPGLWTPCCR